VIVGTGPSKQVGVRFITLSQGTPVDSFPTPTIQQRKLVRAEIHVDQQPHAAPTASSSSSTRRAA
jgi:hypothetical protein